MQVQAKTWWLATGMHTAPSTILCFSRHCYSCDPAVRTSSSTSYSTLQILHRNMDIEGPTDHPREEIPVVTLTAPDEQSVLPPHLWPHSFLALSIAFILLFFILDLVVLPLATVAVILSLMVSSQGSERHSCGSL
jgi:hypothetical protein